MNILNFLNEERESKVTIATKLNLQEKLIKSSTDKLINSPDKNKKY